MDGVADVSWNRYLAYAGVKMEKDPKKPEEGEAPRKSRAWIGIGSSKVGGVLTVANVVEDSPAWKAGLSPKDEIIALDGLKLPADEFERRLDEYEPGDRIRFTLFRSGALRDLALVLGAKENVTWVIRKTKSPTAIQKRIYESWLGNPWDPPGKKK